MQQLLRNRVAVVVGQEVDPLVVEAEVTHQPLDDAGLLEDGVAVGPLRGKAGEGPQREPDPRRKPRGKPLLPSPPLPGYSRACR